MDLFEETIANVSLVPNYVLIIDGSGNISLSKIS
jgi:hypothetical protein